MAAAVKAPDDLARDAGVAVGAVALAGRAVARAVAAAVVRAADADRAVGAAPTLGADAALAIPPHWPRPLQLLGQRRSVQPGPVQPSAHTHSPPSMHVPWHLDGSAGSAQLHMFGQTTSSHAGPPQPASHRQRSGAAHSPRPEHPRTLEQSERLQLSPKRPGSHSHVKGAVQTPWPEQLAAQTGVPHVGPDQPGAHAQPPLARQTPWGELQSSGHERELQSAPPHPASHVQLPPRQTPRPEHSVGSPGQRSSSHAEPVQSVIDPSPSAPESYHRARRRPCAAASPRRHPGRGAGWRAGPWGCPP